MLSSAYMWMKCAVLEIATYLILVDILFKTQRVLEAYTKQSFYRCILVVFLSDGHFEIHCVEYFYGCLIIIVQDFISLTSLLESAEIRRCVSIETACIFMPWSHNDQTEIPL